MGRIFGADMIKERKRLALAALAGHAPGYPLHRYPPGVVASYCVSLADDILRRNPHPEEIDYIVAALQAGFGDAGWDGPPVNIADAAIEYGRVLLDRLTPGGRR